VRFARRGSSCLDWTAILLDPILAVLIVVNPIVYGVAGRSTSVKALSPLASIAGLFTLFRVWYNLGPNVYTKLGGILFFVLCLCGVFSNVVYNAIDDEWVHALISGSFISSVIPLTVAFWNAESLDPNEEEEEEEDTKEEDVDEKRSSLEHHPISVEEGTEDKVEKMNDNNTHEDIEQHT